MPCTSCGNPLPSDARFCSRCGEKVALTSLLGVGTDLPPAPTREELLAQAQAARAEAQARAQAQGGGSETVTAQSGSASSAGSDSAGSDSAETNGVAPEAPRTEPIQMDNAVTPRHEPTAVLPAALPLQRDAGVPMRREPAAARDNTWSRRPSESQSAFPPGRIAAMVATFVVLTLVGTFALSKMFGSNAPQASADPAATSAASGPAGSSGEPSTEESPEPSDTPTTEESPSEDVSDQLPDGARRCSSSGKSPVATAWSGNKDTSCAYSKAVRKAYQEAGGTGGEATFRAFSPVTKRWYDVTCEGSPLVRCVDASGAAVVFLGPRT
ncbi:zinc ribbon domain-containing protein [Knoellia sinensis]|nr:zinc ribbon domain-containing protein [Knoellia sinensis]